MLCFGVIFAKNNHKGVADIGNLSEGLANKVQHGERKKEKKLEISI